MAVTLKLIPIAQQLAIKALLETGKSERQTAKLSGVSRATVAAVKNRQDLDPERVNRIKAGLAGKFYDAVDRSIDHITDKKLKSATAQQLMMTAAIGTDKARLIEGKATSRTEYVDASDKEINDEIARLEDELGKWQTGAIINAEAEDITGFKGEGTTPTGQQAPETVAEGDNGAV